MANHLLSVNLQNFLINSGFYANVQAIGGAKNIYIFSQQGYAMLVKLLKSKLAKKIYKQMVRGCFGMKKAISYEDGYNGEHINQNAGTHPRHNIALSDIARNEIYLEKIFGKRTKMLETFGYCTSQAAVKASESIRKDTGINLMEHLQVRSCETDCRGFVFPNEQCKKETPEASAPRSPEVNVKDTQDVSVSEQIHKTKDVSDTQVPKNYRGWNLNRRGKNKNGEETFNLVRKINGKRDQKYLGVWDQEKADRIIDELNRKHSE